MPSASDAPHVMEQFREIGNMPGVIGAIDCTHIQIRRPTCAPPGLYRNRKGYFSLHVQAVCGPNLEFYNVIVRWWGSVHDSNIFENSRLCQEMEDGRRRGHLLGDMGYTCHHYLFTPIVEAQRGPGDQVQCCPYQNQEHH